MTCWALQFTVKQYTWVLRIFFSWVSWLENSSPLFTLYRSHQPFVIYFCSFLPTFFPRSFAKAVGCQIASLKACAKKKPFQALLRAQLKVFHFLNFLPFAPVVDGYFMPGISYFTINATFCRKLGNLIHIQEPLLGACNSHNKPMQRHFYRPVYFWIPVFFSRNRQVPVYMSTLQWGSCGDLNSRGIQTKNKSVSENAVTGI